jgi:uracil-DNA glycosylase family 4
MSTDSAADELHSLIQQTEELVVYFQELGVAGILLDPTQPMEMPNQVLSQSAPTAATPPPAEGAVPRRALDRSAAAVHSGPKQPVVPAVPLDSLFGDLLPPAEALSRSGESIEQIWADIGDCTRCPLHQCRTNIVHTEGNRKARLMFVGEAPGADEDAQARPFVGRAGQLLTKIIESIGFKREEVLIGNVNRCRPPGNRAPTPGEVAMCKPFLLREIAAIQPEVIVVLGNTAMKNLLEVKEGITRLRGIFQDYKGIKIMPTFHPAYLLRDPSKKRETWEDLKKVRDYLDSTAHRES